MSQSFGMDAHRILHTSSTYREWLPEMSESSQGIRSLDSQPATRPEPLQISYSVLVVSALGFALWGLGWLVLIPNHESQLGWALEFVGPFLIAVSLVMFEKSLSPRIGRPAAILASLGAFLAALSTSIFALNPTNLETTAGVSFGYGAYGAGLVLGALSLGAVLARKESHLGDVSRHEYPMCRVGCHCDTVVHSSFSSIALGGAGLLIWGIGFLALGAQPAGSELGWILAVIGSTTVTGALAAHFAHLSTRFGRAALVCGMLSAVIWSVGYLLQAINPNAGVLSSWYTMLFICYGVGHILTAVSLLIIARRKAQLEQ
ncbi:unannotated protein [freshwater metagenome]|uniref:Unannotated protein n=1 Tax=freshwater metagenome TaxID=449393 RepID=A0A6J7L5T4_9ZZZZ